MRAAHRLREATQKQEAGRQVSPVAQLLAPLQEGSGENNGGSRADAWKGLIGLTSKDGAAALDLLQQQGGGISFLGVCFQNKDKTNEVRLLTYLIPFLQKNPSAPYFFLITRSLLLFTHSGSWRCGYLPPAASTVPLSRRPSSQILTRLRGRDILSCKGLPSYWRNVRRRWRRKGKRRRWPRCSLQFSFARSRQARGTCRS